MEDGVKLSGDVLQWQIQVLQVSATGECMRMEFIGRNAIALKMPVIVLHISVSQKDSSQYFWEYFLTEYFSKNLT